MGIRGRTLALVGGLLVAAVAVIACRMLVDGRAYWLKGLDAEGRGEYLEAIRHHTEAGRHYLPFGPYHARAIARLDAIAVGAIQRGDYPLGRHALEAERSALLSTRSLYIPMAARLPEIELRLARVLAATEDPTAQPGDSFEVRTQWHLARLVHHPAPNGTWVLLALAGAGGLIAASLFFFRRALTPTLHLRKRPAILFGSVFLLSFALFLLGLRFA